MEKSMDNAARVRQRILALFLPLTAVLYIGAEGLTPKGLDQVVQTRATAFKMLPIVAKHPAQLYLAGSLALLALGALAVSYARIGGIGPFSGPLVNVLVYPSLAAVATAHLSQDAAARFLVTAFNSGFGHAFLYAYFIGIFAAPVLMGFALWRSRSVPRWLAVMFVVGLEVAQQVQSKGIVVVLAYTLLFAVAMILLAARIWQAAARPAAQTNNTVQTPLAAASPDPATTPPQTGPAS